VNAWSIVRIALMVLACAPFAYYAIAIFAAHKFFRGAQPQHSEPSGSAADFTPAISILKPVRGLDREAYDNFASFCRQDYPEFEILFCAADREDPAVPVIEQLIRDFPHRSIRLLIGSEPLGASDKVNKLARMTSEARHEIILICDSDVRVEPGFLRAVAAPFRDPQIGGATCLYRGLTDGSFASDLTALGNSTDFAEGVLVAWLFGGVKFMLGAVMATTKTRLAEIGGFESMANHFSDDYELGSRIAAKGHRIELSTFPVSIVYPHEGLLDAFRQQVRWNLSIRFSRPGGHFGLIFTQGLAWMALGMILAHTWLGALGYLLAYEFFSTDAALSVGARGMKDQLVRRRQWMLPVRDAFAFLAWLASFFPQRIRWRGQQFRVRNRLLVPVASQKSNDSH
jgi:ceramide glucosyltransferase